MCDRATYGKAAYLQGRVAQASRVWTVCPPRICRRRDRSGQKHSHLLYYNCLWFTELEFYLSTSILLSCIITPVRQLSFPNSLRWTKDGLPWCARLSTWLLPSASQRRAISMRMLGLLARTLLWHGPKIRINGTLSTTAVTPTPGLMEASTLSPGFPLKSATSSRWTTQLFASTRCVCDAYFKRAVLWTLLGAVYA